LRSLYDLDLTGKIALVLGNEHYSVSDEAADMIQSLNVSVACAVTVYEAMRQRLGKRVYPEKPRKTGFTQNRNTIQLN
jgi:tRNA (guanosine-2'-O-)-methyltransferase